MFKATAKVCATVNVNLATASEFQSIDGVQLHQGDEFLLTGQTAPSQNGLYTLAAGGPELATGSYDGTGTKVIGSLGSRSYYWVRGNGTSAVGESTLTESGILLPDASGNITLHGQISTVINGSLKVISPVREASLDASPEFIPGCIVRVLQGTANSGTWQYTGIANPLLGTTALPWTKANASTGSAVAPPLSPPAYINTAPGALDPCAIPLA